MSEENYKRRILRVPDEAIEKPYKSKLIPTKRMPFIPSGLPHPYKNRTMRVHLQTKDYQGINGKEFTVEDWAWNVWGGKSLKEMGNLPVCFWYRRRVEGGALPDDEAVVYGKVGSLAFLVHQSELKFDK